METCIDTEVIEYPHANLVGIQFGLLSVKDVMKVSVFHRTGEPDLAAKRKLTDIRLGLPNSENECGTCGERGYQKCEGHFGHLVFPSPVYHPNHVSDIVKILNSLCLHCLFLKNIKITSVLSKREAELEGSEGGACQYCEDGDYPVHVKLERRVESNKDVIEKICLELAKDNILPDDYLNLLGKKLEDFDSGRHFLLPSEVLNILTRLTDKVVQQLNIDERVSRPEALVIEWLLIPPNCNRIPEDGHMKFGADRVTNMLAKILTKLPFMMASKATVMNNRIAVEEMQCLLSHYFRVKGAPKVRCNREPSVDYVRGGKLTNRKVSLNNLQKHVAGKVSSFSCRAVLTGDTYLMLDEIGIPFEIAKGLTVRETVTEHNLKRMQAVVDYGPSPSTETGALYYIRGGVKTDMMHCQLVTLAIGDVIGRHLQDGDYVFCNRAPSVHKHSMLGLRARVLDIPTIAINPLVCMPLGADFDGDCLHVFVPQCMESKMEVKELMMVQNQMLTSHGGQCTFTLTQDALLAAYKLTSSHLFVTKTTMEQGCMCTRSSVPKPAVVKSPKGTFWTGAQLFQLSFPAGLDYTRDGVLISSSEILVMSGEPEWLGSSSDSLLQMIIQQYGGDVGLDYLGLCQLMLVQWLSQAGFSVGSYDAYTTASWSTRADLKKEIRGRLDEKEKTVSKKMQKLNYQLNKPSEQEEFARDCQGNPAYAPMFLMTLEKLGLQYMQTVLSEVEDVSLKHVSLDNSILEMVRAGSKGSIKKFVEQFGFLGLQLYKGKYRHPVKEQSLNPPMTMATVRKQNDRKWEREGLVKSSYIEGLNPHEFYIHTVSHREAMIRQALQVSQPGFLSKNLMLFARDIYIDYDGTVRNHHGKLLIQFQYGGTKEGDEHSQNLKQVGPKLNKLSESRWGDKVLAGEPVGILAATAITQPAYQMLLESPKLLDDLAINPLELLQETLYSRRASVMKQCDQRVVLYLSKTHGYSKEDAAIKVNQLLRYVTLEMLVFTASVNFGGSLNGEVWEGLKPAKKSPWIAHLSLHKHAMDIWNVSIECILGKLKSAYEIHEFGALSFFSREICDLNCPGSTGAENNPCISFCATHAQSPSIEESLSRMRNQILPHVMQVSIMGHRSIESVSIVPSNVSSEPWFCRMANNNACLPQHEVVVEVIVKRSFIKRKRDAWLIVQELCGPVLDLVDWSKSIPSGIQGIACVYGIDAAHSCIYQRLKSVLTMFDKTVYTQHILLMTDIITHSGNVIGLNAAGFREFSNTLNVSAPMTLSLFKSSVKHFQDAALKGKCDDLSGTLPSICWGKPARIGTGSDFQLIWRDTE